MIPTDERLDRVGRARVHAHLRLDVHTELTLGQGSVDVAQQLDVAASLDANTVVVPLDLGGEPLRTVHRDVGRAQQIRRRPTVPRSERHADAHVDADREPADPERLRELGAECAHQALDLRTALCARSQGLEYGELVPGQPRGHGGGRQAVGESPGECGEQRVADVMSQFVVDLLEPIEVDQQHHRRCRSAGTTDDHVDAFGEGPTVREARQRVVTGLVGAFEGLSRRLEDEKRRDREQGREGSAELDADDPDRRERQQCTLGGHPRTDAVRQAGRECDS